VTSLSGWPLLSSTASGTIYRHPFFTKWTLEVEEDKLFFRAGLDESLDSLMHGFTESRAPTIRAVDLGGRDTIYRGLTTERLNPGDQSLLQSAISLTVGVMLVMLERPQMVAHGSFTGKRAKSGAEFWAPNIVGKTYRVESDLPHRDGHGVSRVCIGGVVTGGLNPMGSGIFYAN